MFKYCVLIALLYIVCAQSDNKSCPFQEKVPCNAFLGNFQLYYEAPTEARMITAVTNNRSSVLDAAQRFFKERYGLDYAGAGVQGSSLVWFNINPTNRYIVYSGYDGRNGTGLVPLTGIKVTQEQIAVLVLDPNGIPLGGHHNGTIMLLNQMVVWGEAKFIDEATGKEVYPPMIFKTIHFIDILAHGFSVFLDVEHPIFGQGKAFGNVVFDVDNTQGIKHTIGSVVVNFPGTLSDITQPQLCYKLPK